LEIDNGEGIVTILEESKIPAIIVDGYNRSLKMEKESNYRPQFTPYLLNIAESIEKLDHEEVRTHLKTINGWTDISKLLEQRRFELNEYQTSFKVEPSTNINTDIDEFMGEFGEGMEGDENDYDIELAEVLLSKLEIETK